jgi:hypothetical protein
MTTAVITAIPRLPGWREFIPADNRGDCSHADAGVYHARAGIDLSSGV